MKFKCVSSHPESIEGGAVVAPGEEIELTREQYEATHFQDRLAHGAFIGLSPKARREASEAREEATK